MSKSKIAVFDIDGTLYRWQLFHELVEELAVSGVFAADTFHHVDNTWNDWRGGEVSFHDYEMFMVRTLRASLPRISLAEFDAACEKVVERSGHKLHAYPKQLLKQLKNDGYTIIAISGSQQELLELFGKRHGFDIVVGAEYERGKTHFTGKELRRTVGQKAEILKKLLSAHNLTLDGSVGIGDSDGDIDMLSLVERPIAFNPSEGLFKEAKRHNWSIVVERKNIAYRLEKQNDALVLAETIVY